MPTVKSKSKPTIKKSKPAKSKPAKAFKAKTQLIAHWLQDTSLENFSPIQSFAPGERQVDLTIRAHQIPLSHPSHHRLDMRLRAHILVQDAVLVLAETRYAAIVDKSQTAAGVDSILTEMYPFARQALADTLHLAGHEPPLPEVLDLSKTKVS
jgi:hypothetical protein